MEKVPVPWLENFIIFNPTLCVKEGQEQEKILFYYCKNEVYRYGINLIATSLVYWGYCISTFDVLRVLYYV